MDELRHPLGTPAHCPLTGAMARTLAAYFLAWQLLAGVVTAVAIVVTHSHHPVAALGVLLLVLNPLILHQVFFRQQQYSVRTACLLGPPVRVRVLIEGPVRGPLLQTLVLYWAMGWRSVVLGAAVSLLLLVLRTMGLPLALKGGLAEVVDIAVVFGAFQWFACFPYGRTRVAPQVL